MSWGNRLTWLLVDGRTPETAVGGVKVASEWRGVAPVGRGPNDRITKPDGLSWLQDLVLHEQHLCRVCATSSRPVSVANEKLT